MKDRIVPTLLLLVLMSATGAALAQHWGDNIILREPAPDDLYSAGSLVQLLAPAAGDLRVAGQSVEIAADIAGHAVAAGQRITLGRGHRIGGFAWLAGESVVLEGEIGGPLAVAAGTVILTGTVHGDARLFAERIELREGARIAGDLRWRSGEPPRIAAGAVVEGEIVGEPEPPRPPVHPGLVVAGVAVLVAGLLFTGIVLYLLFPGAAAASAQVQRARPGASFLVGLAVVAATPLLIFLLFLFPPGALLALMLLALYLVLLPLGWFIGAFGIGARALAAMRRTGAASRGATLAVFAGTLVLLFLLQLIPLLGQLLAILVLLSGTGALGLMMAEHYRLGVRAAQVTRSPE